jgi:hypothetical protein
MNRSLGGAALLVWLCVSAGGAPLEEISDHAYPISANGSLKIRNADGTIYIYTWAENAVRVISRKRSYSPERLKGIAVNVSINGETATIEAVYPPMPQGLSLADRSGTVDFLIFVPQGSTIADVELDTGEVIVDGIYGPAVNARLKNGRMTLQNCFSEAHVSVTEGALDVVYDWGEPKRFSLTAEIARGHLRVGLPSITAVQIDAESGDGKIFNQFARENEPTEQMGKWHIVIGDGSGAEFKLHAAHGNIGILKNE